MILVSNHKGHSTVSVSGVQHGTGHLYALRTDRLVGIFHGLLQCQQGKESPILGIGLRSSGRGGGWGDEGRLPEHSQGQLGQGTSLAAGGLRYMTVCLYERGY